MQKTVPHEGAEVSVTTRLLNRELSTLEYNARLLDLAEDPALPLLERVRMCRFCSSNLDEFFMVRVAGLLDQATSGFAVRSADGLAPRAALASIRTRVLELTGRQARIWRKTLRPALAEAGIVVADLDELDRDELQELETRFEQEIFPVLTPLGFGPGQPFPYISGLTLSLCVLARDPDSGEERFARVKVPEGLPRFLEVGSRGRVLLLEQAISHFLDWLFPGMEVVERAAFRVTRDADFELSDDADDLLEAVEHELLRRRFGDVVRLEVSRSISRAMLERLQEGVAAEDDQVYAIHGPLDLADLDQLTELDRPELRYEPSPGVVCSVSSSASEGAGSSSRSSRARYRSLASARRSARRAPFRSRLSALRSALPPGASRPSRSSSGSRWSISTSRSRTGPRAPPSHFSSPRSGSAQAGSSSGSPARRKARRRRVATRNWCSSSGSVPSRVPGSWARSRSYCTRNCERSTSAAGESAGSGAASSRSRSRSSAWNSFGLRSGSPAPALRRAFSIRRSVFSSPSTSSTSSSSKPRVTFWPSSTATLSWTTSAPSARTPVRRVRSRATGTSASLRA